MKKLLFLLIPTLIFSQYSVKVVGIKEPLTFPPHTAPNSNNSTNAIRILKQGSAQPRAVCYSCILGAPFLVGGVT